MEIEYLHFRKAPAESVTERADQTTAKAVKRVL